MKTTVQNNSPAVFLLVLLPTLSVAFVPPSSSLLAFGILPTYQRISRIQQEATHLAAKTFVEEILDGLDQLAGVSPLNESDLKTANVDLVKRAEERAENAPPSDALEKPSVSVFFFLLGFVPVVLSALAIKSGARPLGL